VKILFIGDVQGESAVIRLRDIIGTLRQEQNIDLVIANGENSADTNGITPQSAQMLFDSGADVITTGNHVFKRKEADSLFETRAEVIRPANLGESCPGKGVHIIDFGYCEVAVVNIMGMTFMPRCDNPFKVIDEILPKITTKNIIVDFHAEATSEKKAMAYHLSGRVSAVIGTHTHVQTADEQIIDDFTAFISDVGMVGAADSVIGADKSAIMSFTEYYPVKFFYPKTKAIEFNAVIIQINPKTGKAMSIKRVKKII
jgi:hypothetical protein